MLLWLMNMGFAGGDATAVVEEVLRGGGPPKKFPQHRDFIREDDELIQLISETFVRIM